MGAATAIEWCDHTMNPWIGCTKVSPGCANCYAAVNTFTRAQRAHGRELWGPDAARHVTSEAKWREPLRWDRAARKAAGDAEMARARGEGNHPAARPRVFCASMADVFEDREDLTAPRLRLLSLIAETPHLDWLLLTKRPENVTRLLTDLITHQDSDGVGDYLASCWIDGEPPPNVWLGTTVEDQARADERIPHLLAVPAAVRFLSVEPLLGPVDLSRVRVPNAPSPPFHGHALHEYRGFGRRIDWVIGGGESGPGARPCAVAWIRDVVRQCREARVPVFVKQLGANVRDRNDAGFDGDDPTSWPAEIAAEDRVEDDPDGGGVDRYQGAPVRVRLADPKGGDPAEWPEDLRVREFPEVARA